MTEQRIVAILGMSRSGTSFFSSWLQKCGLNIGDDLKKADDYLNKKGYYEDIDFEEFYVEIEKGIKGNFWNRLWVIPYDDYQINEEKLNKGKVIIEKKMKQNQQWGWKFPQTTLIWNICWNEIFEELNFKNKTIVLGTFRHFQRTVQSYMKLIEISRKSGKFYHVIHYMLLKNRWANFILKQWIRSNKTLIDILYKNEYKMSILLDSNTLLMNSKKIFQILHNDFELNLNYVDPYDLYDEKLMDRKVDIKYKLNKKLVKEATEVYEKLIKLRDAQSFMHTGNFNNVISSIPQ